LQRLIPDPEGEKTVTFFFVKEKTATLASDLKAGAINFIGSSLAECCPYLLGLSRLQQRRA
jgi:hypothetical protein